MNNRRMGGGGTSSAPRSEQTRRSGQNPYAEGSRYYDLWESNPWTDEKMTQKQTVWDRFANMLGFRSAYDTAKDQRAQAAAEYDAQITQLKGEDEYNSPEAQKARMQAAGINPDIAGGVEGSSAAEFAQEATAPEITPDENMAKIGGLFNGIAQAITMASGLTGDVLTMLGTGAELTSKRLANAKSIDELSNMFLLENVTAPNGENPDWVSTNISALFDEGGFADIWADNMHLRGRDKKHFRRTAYANLANAKGKLYDHWKNNLISRNEYGKIVGSNYTVKTDNFDEIIDCFMPLTKCYDEYIQYSAEANAQDAKNKKVYNYTWKPKTAAETENALNEREGQQAKLDENMKKAFAETMEKLTNKAQEGDKMAWFLTLILPPLYEHLMNASVSFNRNKQGSMQVKEATM